MKFITSLLVALALLIAAPARAANYEQNATQATQIGIYTIPVSSLSLPGNPSMCPGQELDYPNIGTAAAHLAYPFPTSGCTGLGCFPTVTLKRNGTALANPSWSCDASGCMVGYMDSVAAGDQLVLYLQHQNGVTTLNPSAGHLAKIVATLPCP